MREIYKSRYNDEKYERSIQKLNMLQAGLRRDLFDEGRMEEGDEGTTGTS